MRTEGNYFPVLNSGELRRSQPEALQRAAQRHDAGRPRAAAGVAAGAAGQPAGVAKQAVVTGESLRRMVMTNEIMFRKHMRAGLVGVSLAKYLRRAQ